MADTGPSAVWQGGVAVYASGSGTGRVASLEQVTTSGQPYGGLWIAGRGAFTVLDSSLSGGPGVKGREGTLHGNGIYASGVPSAWNGTLGLYVSGTTIEGSLTGVLLDGATGTFEGMTWATNTVDLVQQDCDGVDAPTWDVAPGAYELCSQIELGAERLVFSITP
jgi:hypothetical protein